MTTGLQGFFGSQVVNWSGFYDATYVLWNKSCLIIILLANRKEESLWVFKKPRVINPTSKTIFFSYGSSEQKKDAIFEENEAEPFPAFMQSL